MILTKRNNKTKQKIIQIPTHVIAACPTCYPLVEKLDSQKYSVIKTNSTAESLSLLVSGKVDSILAGRTLKPSEPSLESHMIRSGFSFLSGQETTLRKEELNKYEIFTDLDTKQLKFIFNLDNIVKVDDVYQYLDKGIVITSWDNTDYTKAQMIHVIDESGNRLALSRQPTLYCKEECDLQLLTDVSSISQ